VVVERILASKEKNPLLDDFEYYRITAAPVRAFYLSLCAEEAPQGRASGWLPISYHVPFLTPDGSFKLASP